MEYFRRPNLAAVSEETFIMLLIYSFHYWYTFLPFIYGSNHFAMPKISFSFIFSFSWEK